MSNEYFNNSGAPGNNSQGSSAVIRGEFGNVANGFAKLPVMAEHGSELVVVNPSGTALTTTTTPVLGTPASGTLTNCTGLPIGTGIAGLGTGVAVFLATPSSANLAAAVTGETGSGALVFATSPILVTPTIGVATATSVNKVAFTAPTTSATLTIADGKTLTANSSITLAGVDSKTLTLNNSLTFSGTDSSTVAFGTGGTVAYTSGAQTLSSKSLASLAVVSFATPATTGATTGAISIDWSTAQNYKQNEPTGTITYTFTAPAGPCHLQLFIDSDGTSTAQTFNWPGTVIWMGATWSPQSNKKSIISFWYDGTNYYAMGVNQV